MLPSFDNVLRWTAFCLRRLCLHGKSYLLRCSSVLGNIHLFSVTLIAVYVFVIDSCLFTVLFIDDIRSGSRLLILYQYMCALYIKDWSTKWFCPHKVLIKAILILATGTWTLTCKQCMRNIKKEGWRCVTMIMLGTYLQNVNLNLIF